MRREDLRVWKEGPPSGNAWLAEVTDAEFAEVARAEGYVKLDGIERCLTHASEFYDEALCFAQMARLYHETGNNLKGLAWANEQYGACKWRAAIDQEETP